MQTREIAKMLAEAEKLLATKDKKDREKAGVLLLRAHRGVPKSKRLAKFLQEPGIKKLLQDTENLNICATRERRCRRSIRSCTSPSTRRTIRLIFRRKDVELIPAREKIRISSILPDLAAELSEIEGMGSPFERTGSVQTR